MITRVLPDLPSNSRKRADTVYAFPESGPRVNLESTLGQYILVEVVPAVAE